MIYFVKLYKAHIYNRCCAWVSEWVSVWVWNSLSTYFFCYFCCFFDRSSLSSLRPANIAPQNEIIHIQTYVCIYIHIYIGLTRNLLSPILLSFVIYFLFFSPPTILRSLHCIRRVCLFQLILTWLLRLHSRLRQIRLSPIDRINTMSNCAKPRGGLAGQTKMCLRGNKYTQRYCSFSEFLDHRAT